MWRAVSAVLLCVAVGVLGLSRDVQFAAADDAPAKAVEKRPAPKAAPVKKSANLLEGLFQGDPAAKAIKDRATHKEVQSIVVKGKTPGHSLQTFCVTPTGDILAVVGPPKGYSGAKNNPASQGEIQVFDGDGQALRTFAVPFAPQSINVGPQGQIFVAGSGKLAKFDDQGTLLTTVDAPHLTNEMKDGAALRKLAQEQLDEESKGTRETLAALREELEELKAKQAKAEEKAAPAEGAAKEAAPKDTPADADADKAKAKAEKLAASQKRRRQQLELNIRNYEQRVGNARTKDLDNLVASLTSRLMIINSLAVSDTDVFYTCGESKGYGYALWRVTADFKEPKKITGGLSGCCGQMDIQCHKGDVYAAENSRHRIVHFNRDGKNLGSFGNSSRIVISGSAAGGDPKPVAVDKDGQFGGCCNPMNLRLTPEGNILTAESEGYVKLFSPEGKLVSVIGVAKVSGGCKNVAVAASPKGDRVYFYDVGGRIVVLARTEPLKTSSLKASSLKP